MLINFRNALMTGKRLPYDAEVEFLQSDGQAFVNTGFVVEVGSKITCNIGMASSYGSTYGYFGASDGTGLYLGGGFNCTSPFNDRRLSVWVKNELWWCSTASTTNIYQDGTLHSMSIDLSSSAPSVSFDGQSISYAAGYTSGVATMPSIPTYLFAVNSAGTAKIVPASAAVKIGSFRVEKNDEIKLDVIAVRKGTVGYLYDRVSGKLFGNEGSGDFVLGQDVVPVEYIESHGTEYIDTGFKADRSTVVKCALSVVSRGTNGYVVWGAAKGDGSSGLNDAVALAEKYNRPSTLFLLDTYNNNNAQSISYGQDMLIECVLSDGSITINGTTTSHKYYTLNKTADYPIWVFGENLAGNLFRPSQIKLRFLQIMRNGVLVRSFRPVRVGTGSTWEGAMMDVLTRRIYRNAGTGAFTYGNDLKYPIPAE